LSLISQWKGNGRKKFKCCQTFITLGMSG